MDAPTPSASPHRWIQAKRAGGGGSLPLLTRAMQKFKRLRGQLTKAWRWLDAARQREPQLFAHWHLLASTPRRTVGAV